MRRALAICTALALLLPATYFINHACAAEPQFKFSYASYVPPNHKMHPVHENWGKEIEKRTNGRVKIIYYPAQTLVQAPWTYDGVVKGIADIGHFTPSHTRGLFPLLEVLDLPLGSNSGYWSVKVNNAFIEKFKPKELDQVHFLWASSPGPFIVHTSKTPVNRLEDLKGLKIRAGGVAEAVMRALGATPVAMPVTETYDALQKGVVDGLWLPNEALLNYRIAEVSNYTTLNYGASTGSLSLYAMNKKKWDSLPADIKKIFDDMSREQIEIQAKFWQGIDQEGIDFANTKGHKFLKVSGEETARWTAAVKPVYDNWVNSVKAKGLPGDEALKFCRDYLQKNMK